MTKKYTVPKFYAVGIAQVSVFGSRYEDRRWYTEGLFLNFYQNFIRNYV